MDRELAVDLANAPGINRRTHAVGMVPGQRVEARMVDLAEASSEAFQSAWQQLASRVGEPNPYFEPWFALPSLEAFARKSGGGARVEIVTLRASETLVGLFPVARSLTYYGYRIPHLASWSHDNSFCGSPLVVPGHEERFWRSLFELLERRLGSALFLHLARLPVEGPLYQALQSVIAQQRRPSAVVASESRALLQSDLSPEDYLAASLTAKKRKELRRQHKRLSEEGALVFSREAGSENLDRWIDEFLALEAAGWKGDGGTALANAAETRRFFAAALRGAADAGKLERLTLRLNDRPIAMLANFICPPGAYSFKTAYDERFARYSPGMLLQLENLDLLDRDDVAWTDSCAVEGHPMIERLWRERRSFAAINIALGGSLRRTVFRAMTAYETRNRSAS